ncbi:MAG: Ser-Thr-rich GPI-anchored membrane family protein, partial [Candidatus Kariarchaeaceae archaeon]
NIIRVTSPNGGEDYLIGSSQIITWTDNLTDNVEIQLFKGGLFYSSITTSTASDGSYTWNISNSLLHGSDYKIRISSVSDGGIFDFSDADFTLSNKVIVTIPNGGESWQQGTTHTISWSDNLNDNVKIELFKAGVFDSEITSSTPSNGSFQWNIPINVAPGTDYKVKVTNSDNASVFDFSDANFEIFEGNITVVAPNGEESWQAGTSQVITWIDNINENVTIELYKGGTLHSVIDPSTGSDGLKFWDIPFTLEPGTDYKVKITSVDDPSITDFSDANFTIIGNQIAVTSPNGGEILLEADDYIITWNDNLTGSVKIQLIKNDLFHSSITTSTPSDGSYTWNPPASTPSGTDYKIKIISVADATIFDLSDSTFTIISNSITVLSPNGGENWVIGSTHTITWIDDISGQVKIELYKAGVIDTTIAISVPSSGSYNWDFAGVTPGTDYRIKILSIDQPALFDMSNNDFTLFAGDITVTSPNGGESWQAGNSQIVLWNDNIDGEVIIELYKGGVPDSVYSLISGRTASDGAKNWDIPFDIPSGDDYQVKITSVENSNIFDFSDADFSIEGFEITITTPNGDEIWYVGQDYNITWTDNLTGNIEIHLYKGGVFHSVIDASDPSDGNYIWSTPIDLETGSDFTIRISSVDNANIFDDSDNGFSLAHNIIVSSPNGGESWLAGSVQIISWSDNLSGNVRIELWKTDTLHTTIVNTALSDGSYTWDIDVNLEASINYKIKIVSVENVSVYDYSDNNFEIFSASVTVISPNGGEIWQAGNTYSINWTSDISENIKIELYKSGSIHLTIVASTSNDGAYNWTDMPFTTESGSDYRVKITSITNSNTFDFSDGNFSIVGNEITVTSPNGGENWVMGSPYFITWDDNLTGTVEIYLIKSGEFNTFISAGTPSDGTFTWVIPSSTEEGNDYTIRVASKENSNILDDSDDDFTISNPTDVEELFSGIPESYELKQNFPNPFNPSTTIYYALPEESAVELMIYDVLGNQVLSYTVDKQSAGYHKYIFNAPEYKSGVYIYRLRTKNYVETKKMVLMK